MTATRRLLRFTALLITVAVIACHRDPAVAEREFVARADRYMAAGQVEAAILELSAGSSCNASTFCRTYDKRFITL